MIEVLGGYWPSTGARRLGVVSTLFFDPPGGTHHPSTADASHRALELRELLWTGGACGIPLFSKPE